MPNLATVLVGSIVFGIFAAIIVRGIRNRKAAVEAAPVRISATLKNKAAADAPLERPLFLY